MTASAGARISVWINSTIDAVTGDNTYIMDTFDVRVMAFFITAFHS